MSTETNAAAGIARLQQLLKKRPPPPGESCDYCATPVPPAHPHLIDLTARRILCACRPCFLVFQPEGAAQGRYKAIPERYLALPGLQLEDAEWDTLQIPIGLAFFFYNSIEKRMCAFYPGPAGAAESALDLETWPEIAAKDPATETLEDDVEAIIVRRERGAPSLAYIVPIDAAYELVGILRTNWKGFDGGEEAHRKVDAFFEKVGARSRGLATEPR